MADALYTARVHVTGGRGGTAKSPDGAVDLNLKGPVERGGPGGGVNPEQLFAAGYAACFESSIRGAARRTGLDLTDSAIDSRVLLLDDEVGFKIAVEMDVSLPAIDDIEQARALVRDAHGRCPYSKATRGNIDVTVTVNGQPLEH